MRGKLITNQISQEGFSTLELLIAFTVLILSITAAVLVSFSNQSVAIDSQTNNEAITKAQSLLETARAASRQNYPSLSTTATTTDTIYSEQTVIDPLSVTQCGENVYGNVSWTSDKNRSQTVSLSTHLSNVSLAQALGGNCINTPPSSNWNNPQRFASDTLSPGKPTTIDVLNRIVYIGTDKSPYLYIADTHNATLGQTKGLFVAFNNGFDDGAQVNDVKIAKLPDNNTYAFLARHTASYQFEILNVNNINDPVSTASSSLAGVSGSAPQGWRLYYFDNKVYIVTRFTAGPEFHIFNVSTPTSPNEIGSKDLGRTVEDLVITKQLALGSWHYFAYMATDKNNAPLSIYDVTNPSGAVELTWAEPPFNAYQDGMSVYVIGNKLYFGRASDPGGPDLFIYDISNPLASSTLPLLGQADIGTGVNAVRVAGKYAFLGTPKTNQEFQVWDVSDLSNITNIAKFNFTNIVDQGVVYEPDYIYSTGQSTPNFQILYSP